MAQVAAEACDDRRAMEIVLIRVEEVAYLTDWFCHLLRRFSRTGARHCPFR